MAGQVLGDLAGQLGFQILVPVLAQFPQGLGRRDHQQFVDLVRDRPFVQNLGHAHGETVLGLGVVVRVGLAGPAAGRAGNPILHRRNFQRRQPDFLGVRVLEQDQLLAVDHRHQGAIG